MLIAGAQGWIERGLEGFFCHQTRFLSRLMLRVEGRTPRPVTAVTAAHHTICGYHLAESPAGRAAEPAGEETPPSASEIVHKGIEIQLNAFVAGGLHADLIVTNHAPAPARVTLALALAADFADLEEARAGKRQQTAPIERAWSPAEGGGALRLRYRHPALDLLSCIELRDAGEVVDSGETLTFALDLPPHAPRLVSLEIVPYIDGTPIRPERGRDGAWCGAHDSTDAWWESCAEISVSNAAVQSAWDQAVSDLNSMQLREGEGAASYMMIAGIPSYTGLFGRDTLVAGLQSAMLNPLTLRGVLEVVPRFNATERDDDLDAEPGRVLHQRQLGPLAKLNKTPFLHYYGDASASPLFLLAAAADLAHTGDLGFFRAQRDKLLGTLDWIRRNRDEAGFHPYQTRSTRGVKNQSWKDSAEAVLYPDGSMVKAPIAMAGIQALTYAALSALGLAFGESGEADLAAELGEEARALKRRFNEAFWMEDAAFYAIALDPEHQPVRSVASDPGLCLAYGIVDPGRARPVADRLLSPEFFTGWGIRTLSAEHPAYNPLAYHLGAVWPAMNAITAFGLQRHGFSKHAATLAEALFAAAGLFEYDRLPEVFGGHARDPRHPHPGLYPGACSPQAWSSSAVIFLVRTLLGVQPLATRRTLIVDPALPAWLPQLTLRDVQCGDARATLRFERCQDGTTAFDVITAPGIRVVRPPESEPGQDRVAFWFR